MLEEIFKLKQNKEVLENDLVEMLKNMAPGIAKVYFALLDDAELMIESRAVVSAFITTASKWRESNVLKQLMESDKGFSELAENSNFVQRLSSILSGKSKSTLKIEFEFELGQLRKMVADAEEKVSAIKGFTFKTYWIEKSRAYLAVIEAKGNQTSDYDLELAEIRKLQRRLISTFGE